MKLELIGRGRIATNPWLFMVIKYHDSLYSVACPQPRNSVSLPIIFKIGERINLIDLCNISYSLDS